VRILVCVGIWVVVAVSVVYASWHARRVELRGHELCAVLEYYAAYGGNYITFGDTLSVPSSRVKNLVFLALQDGTGRFVPKRR